ncbi:MAG: chemotaxis protein CheB [Promethearchaeota archaeon]|jgi:two-component system chemotaxis response regulator CheB
MPKKVLIASESTFRRIFLSEMLSPHKEIVIIGNVRNDSEAIHEIIKGKPDILILDIEFKNKDWYSQFYPIMKLYPIKVIVLTDVNPKNIDILDVPILLKSYDYIFKPNGIWKDELPKIEEKLLLKILMVDIPINQKMDNKIRLMKKNIFIQQSQNLRTKESKITSQFEELTLKPEVQPTNEPRLEEYFLEFAPVPYSKLENKIVVIGASVGGPRTLRIILSEIPREFPVPILVVQHLNHLFMRQFVVSLRDVCKLNVKIGANYEEINPGTIYFSPGDKHMQVTVRNNKPCIRTFEGEPINFCRPSVDVLFYSTARVFKNKTLGILLTGMGKDGVEGLRAIKSEGGRTIAESEETSILYGMPKVAAETGAADLVIPNYKIVSEIVTFVN